MPFRGVLAPIQLLVKEVMDEYFDGQKLVAWFW